MMNANVWLQLSESAKQRLELDKQLGKSNGYGCSPTCCQPKTRQSTLEVNMYEPFAKGRQKLIQSASIPIPSQQVSDIEDADASDYSSNESSTELPKFSSFRISPNKIKLKPETQKQIRNEIYAVSNADLCQVNKKIPVQNVKSGQELNQLKFERVSFLSAVNKSPRFVTPSPNPNVQSSDEEFPKIISIVSYTENKKQVINQEMKNSVLDHGKTMTPRVQSNIIQKQFSEKLPLNSARNTSYNFQNTLNCNSDQNLRSFLNQQSQDSPLQFQKSLRSEVKVQQGAKIILKSLVQRFRPSLGKDPLLIDRFLVLTEESLSYYKNQPIGNQQKVPILTIPIQQVAECKTLEINNKFYFEVILKTEYEQLYVLSNVKSHISKNTVGGEGHSSKRISKVPLKEMLQRSLPGSFLQQDGSFSSRNINVSVNLSKVKGEPHTVTTTSLHTSSSKSRSQISIRGNRSDLYKLSKNPLRWKNTRSSSRTSVVQGHAIVIRQEDLIKDFGKSNIQGLSCQSWSCRQQDMFNAERRLIFTSQNQANLLKWIDEINNLCSKKQIVNDFSPQMKQAEDIEVEYLDISSENKFKFSTPRKDSSLIATGGQFNKNEFNYAYS